MSDCKKPTAGFGITIATVVLLAYPLSVGPACWMNTRGWLPDHDWLVRIYSPVLCVAGYNETRLGAMLNWYMNFGVPDGEFGSVEIICLIERWKWHERFSDRSSPFEATNSPCGFSNAVLWPNG